MDLQQIHPDRPARSHTSDMSDRQQRMIELTIEVERTTRRLMNLFDLLYLTRHRSQWPAILHAMQPAVDELKEVSEDLLEETKSHPLESEEKPVKRKSPIITLLVLFVLSLLLAGSVVAQEVTPTPEVIEVTATLVESTAIAPTEEATPDPLPPVTNPGVDPGTAVNLITLITGIAIGVVTAGGGFLVTIAVVVSKIRNDRPLLAAIEGLIASRPPEDISKLRELGGVFRDTADIIEEVTDDIPVTTKPLPITPDEAARIRQAAAGKRPEPPQGEPEG